MTNSLCLALAVLIRFEAGPDRAEQERVAGVLVNRFNDPAYRWGQGWDAVIFQRGQFSCWFYLRRDDLDGEAIRLYNQDAASWYSAVTLAMAALAGTLEPDTTATHFHIAELPKPAGWSRCRFLEQTTFHKYYREE
jgi:spore germination cell wall hydrolase CwlJ-like protein